MRKGLVLIKRVAQKNRVWRWIRNLRKAVADLNSMMRRVTFNGTKETNPRRSLRTR
jgi:hypothetical protein